MSDSDLVTKIVSFDIDLEEEAAKEVEFKINNIKKEILDETEDSEGVEHGGSGESLAHQQYIYEQQRRDNGATPSTQEQAEENEDRELKRKADHETGEGGSGEGESGQGTSGESTSDEGASKEKQAKTEEPPNVEDDDSNSKSL